MAQQLSLKREKFIAAYLGEANGNASEAARIAGYKQPHSQGPRLLENAEISSRVRAVVEEAAMSAEQVLRELAKVAMLPADGDPKSVTNKVRALELLGKHHKLYVEKQEVEHSGGVNGFMPVINVYASESEK